jgi:NAD(P)-dependent dehydrogenase (short-subunit alcohol dehydrogenase family)
MFDFSNHFVMITGAAGNLGQALARAFLAAGAHLALIDRSPDRLPGLFPALTTSPDHLLLGGVDANDASSVEGAVRAVLERFGRIDVLVNTVGGYAGGAPVHETPLESWDFMLALNARTAFILSRAVVPAMRAQRSGKIVHVASRAGFQGSGKAAAYSASKAALMRLVESLAAELKQEGINVNCVVPSTIDTPQNRQSMPKADPGRWVSPEALADVILFLASDAARVVHGAAIPAYGLG